MKLLSTQLSDLSDRAKAASVHAKETEDSVAAKRADARAKAEARVDALKADAAKRSDQMHERAVATKAAMATPWINMRKQFDTDTQKMRANMAAAKTERDAKRAERDAELAEEDAEFAIAIALDAVDYAEAAAYQAVLARAEAATYELTGARA